ncbi:hypothetical protein PVV74_16385 [Roseovarius sp. SK2]|uniref:hypothetical protein n=1 Tax=Roseovarius TaxID=74030 RepID=UPI00237C4865|nr:MULTISPECIES: hypothetical protein [unclassified Roseovarius]MDD9727041.1 hypothetical protein [Roseovarius sp. SK2]
MSNPIALLVAGLAAGAGLGALVTATVIDRPAMSNTATSEGMSHDHSAHDHGQDNAMHDHKMVEAGDPAPTLAIELHPDGPQSRNLHIMTTNFTFDPEGVNGDHRPGHGHAHVYINGVKQPRAYSPWVQLDALPKGTHDIRVTLNANTHGHLATNGTPIEAMTTLTIE